MSLGGVDDWLRSELRLAERQGLLQGRHLSPVQFHAGIVLNFQDNVDRSGRALDDLKRSLVSAGWKPEVLFPERFPDAKLEEAPDFTEEGVTFDFSEVDWKSPSDFDPGDFQDLMGQIQGLQRGSLSGDKISNSEWR